MDDINESNYEDEGQNDISDDHIEQEEESPFIDDIEEETEIRRSNRNNAGAGVILLDPSFHGPSHDDKRVQFAMEKIKEHSMEQSSKFEVQEGYKQALSVMFTQMPALKGFKLFGERAVAAMVKELKQLEHGPMPGKKVIVPINPDTLTYEQKRRALNAINLIKKKRDGTIKGRTCADGSKQHRYLKEDEDISSPTLALESLLITLVIDVYEGRDVAFFDIPGAYLHAKVPPEKMVTLKLKGVFVDIMCEINQEYVQHVRYENGQKVLYLRVLRALYGCIDSALQWYMLYKGTLEKENFVLNPYDFCVANKVINGKQCTLTWYVDDNKLSHVEPSVVDSVLNMIKVHFGEITITRGKSHDFLGMSIVLRDDKKIEIDMADQLREAIEAFGEKIDNSAVNPAKSDLFYVDEDSKPLSEEKSDIFHSVTQKLLYITKRARPDLETLISFLTMRVSKSTEQDWAKLKRGLSFIHGTINEKRIIGARNLLDVFTWIDASYAVHSNMRSHTGGAISMGYGVLHAKSSKQKINVKSSTEAELVGVSEYIPHNIWLIMFLKSQGYEMRNNTVYQDNKSAILMEKNGRNSCTGNSRHINVHYFFVKDQIDKGEFKVQYCPTLLMLADFFTKPIVGKRFRELWKVVMGQMSIFELDPSILPPIKERVGFQIEEV